MLEHLPHGNLNTFRHFILEPQGSSPKFQLELIRCRVEWLLNMYDVSTSKDIKKNIVNDINALNDMFECVYYGKKLSELAP